MNKFKKTLDFILVWIGVILILVLFYSVANGATLIEGQKRTWDTLDITVKIIRKPKEVIDCGLRKDLADKCSSELLCCSLLEPSAGEDELMTSPYDQCEVEVVNNDNALGKCTTTYE